MGNYIKVQVLLQNSLQIPFSYNAYDLRKAISSKTIAKVKKLEYIQGHTIGVMLEFYNVYSKKQENIKEIIIGI